MFKRSHVLLVSLGFLLMLTACNITVTPDPDNTPDVGSTVFAAIRWADPSRAMDVVFFADEGYGNLSNAGNLQTFLDDVSDAIDTGFYQNNAVVSNLGRFNFWYSTKSGADVERNADTSVICPTVTWPTITDSAFAEMRVILHRETDVRDCGGGGSATAQAGASNWWIIVHEAGHAMFGLPDEYCCDGGYWNVSPILYNTANACTNDAANSAWRDCVQMASGATTVNWWRSQGTNIDLMRNAGPTVWEIGPAGWVIMRQVLDALPGSPPNDPDVLAPTNWNWN